MGLRKILLRCLRIILLSLFCFLLLSQSALAAQDSLSGVRAFTRPIEFDYVNWTLDALFIKNVQAAINAPQYLSISQQREMVFSYLDLVNQINQQTAEINRVFSDPQTGNPTQAVEQANQRLLELKTRQQKLKPLVESILQQQISQTVADMGLSLGGQPFPPVLYHSTSMPHALIISPRSVIQQDADISLDPEMTTLQMATLEESVEQSSGASALVVDIGGVGIYPTMVMETTDLNWLLEVISHEWTHNYLTLRPLGMSYLVSNDLRTINETTANLSGKEISLEVLKRYYPERVPQPTPSPTPQEQAASSAKAAEQPAAVEVFSFNKEMHVTRVQVDALLASGKIEEAEDYMEQRRRFFWDHGYQIRKLNQAYFAFYGAYNDVPGGGAAGADPVGPAVQELRSRSSSLADFINRIAWVTSFDALQALLR